MSETAEPSIGKLLSQARQVKGMTTADVADKLKLTSRQIEALENEEYDKLPAAVFVRGFIRNYARLVGLDAERLLDSIAHTQGETPTITAPSEGVTISSSPVKRWMLYLVGAVALFLILVTVLYQWLSAGEEAYVASPEPAPAATATALPQTPTAGGGTVTAPDLPPALPAAPAPAVVPSAPAVATTPAPITPTLPAQSAQPTPAASTPPAPAAPARPAAPAVAPAPLTPSVAPATPAAAPAQRSTPVNPYLAPGRPATPPVPAPITAPSGHSSLRFSATDESWVQVVDSTGKRSSQLLTSGASASFTGTPPFRLVVGNAASVSLRYNDQNIDLRPFTGDKVARLKLE